MRKLRLWWHEAAAWCSALVAFLLIAGTLFAVFAVLMKMAAQPSQHSPLSYNPCHPQADFRRLDHTRIFFGLTSKGEECYIVVKEED